jgi:hypothetical protein
MSIWHDNVDIMAPHLPLPLSENKVDMFHTVPSLNENSSSLPVEKLICQQHIKFYELCGVANSGLQS